MAALILGLSGCGVNQGSGDGGNGLAAVQPSRVDPALLREAVTDERARTFYEARQWQPVWNAETAEALVQAISGANRHGLNKDLFLADAARAQEPAAREAALTLAALAYADALAKGRVDPEQIRDVYEIARPEFDAAAALNQGLQQADLAAWFDGLAPQDAEYRALSEAYLQTAQSAGRQQRAPIAAGRAIRPGSSDERLPAIVAALRSDGYLAAAPAEPPVQQETAQKGEAKQASPPPTRYTPELVEAVRRLQQQYGLEPTGIIGEETLAALNGGAFERARTLAVNLERRRWLVRQPPATRIDVNTGGAVLAYWRNGQLANQRRVVVGQPGNETPALGSPMFRLVANPTWTVPRSIQSEEIEPKGAAYMARNNMTWEDGWIVQGSGPKNSLGLVKFDMKNDHAIYLHDTPAKALFEQSDRHQSHGCVRVHDALGFARMIAADQGVTDAWERAQATGEETFVPLREEIPVRLLYHTAFLDGGRVTFRDDAYGWDDDVAEALGLPRRARRAPRTHVQDVGP
ncbi:MAG TPA: L,D-transpeptidase family protein [Allosphingosinicella sp.]|nr:L,D-transpeptidase family protein [Allosphingosinicella sp.]